MKQQGIDLIFDLETIPGQSDTVKSMVEKEIEEKRALISAPSNWKDPSKIENYIETQNAKLDAEADEIWRKTALDGTKGEIATVSWAFGDGEIDGIARDDLTPKSEIHLLQGFFGAIVKEIQRTQGRVPRWIGHNILGFDLRFILHRAVILEVPIPFKLPVDDRHGYGSVYDTMVAWAGFRNYVKMDQICMALGIPTKGKHELELEEMDGSQVWDFVRDGKIESVLAYNKGDVARTREILKRIEQVTRPLQDNTPKDSLEIEI